MNVSAAVFDGSLGGEFLASLKIDYERVAARERNGLWLVLSSAQNNVSLESGTTSATSSAGTSSTFISIKTNREKRIWIALAAVGKVSCVRTHFTSRLIFQLQ